MTDARYVVVAEHTTATLFGHPVTIYRIRDNMTGQYSPLTYNNIGDARKAAIRLNRTQGR
jgi:hypothetical protein